MYSFGLVWPENINNISMKQRNETIKAKDTLFFSNINNNSKSNLSGKSLVLACCINKL